jgi:hypothetical protein
MKWIFYLFLFFFLLSCNKAEDRKCFKKIGKVVEKTINVPPFHLLHLLPKIEYVLIQDSTDKLVIKGGENLINFIEWKVNDSKLEIKNTNACNFLRKLDHVIVVEIHFTKLINILFEGSEKLSTKGKLKTDYFVLHIVDGAGPVNINIEAITLQADIAHGWGDYTLSGKANYARIAARSNGFCDTYQLILKDSIRVENQSAGNLKVNADGIALRGEIKKFW